MTKTSDYYEEQLNLLNKNVDFNEEQLNKLYNEMDKHVKAKNYPALRQDEIRLKAFIARCRQDIRLIDKNIKEIERNQNEQTRGNSKLDKK